MRAWPVVPALLFTGFAAAAQTPSSTVRVKLDPAEGAVVGQPVNLMVDVLFAGEMAHPPRVTVPEVKGAQLIRFETQGVTLRDTIDGAAAIGQEFTFVVIPRRGGTLTIPPAEIELLDKAGDVIGTAKGEAQTLAVTVPKGIDASMPVIASTSVSANESWSPDSTAPLAAGGALVRTIVRQAADVPALGMADFSFTAPEGVRVYVDPSVIEDRINRGVITGHRTDRVTYVFEKAGAYALPALSQPWWDLGAKAAKAVSLPGVSVTVAPAEVKKAAGEPAPTAPGRPRLDLVLAAGTVLALALLVLLWRSLRPRWWAWRERREGSEAWARRALCNAACSGDQPATYKALSTWLARLGGPEREAARNDPSLGAEIATLECAVFGAGAWGAEDGQRLAASAKGYDVALSKPKRDAGRPLPPLNPVLAATQGVSQA